LEHFFCLQLFFFELWGPRVNPSGTSSQHPLDWD
jgi:hypothetical protein